MTNPSKIRPPFSPEVRERAIRMVRGHRADHPSEWATIVSNAAKIGCTEQTLSNWVKQDATVAVLLSATMLRRLQATIREMTPANWGRSITTRM